jgi:hypothetical protein
MAASCPNRERSSPGGAAARAGRSGCARQPARTGTTGYGATEVPMVDSYGTFLSRFNKDRSLGGAANPSRRLLVAAAGSGPRPAGDLMAASGLGIVEFAAALQDLKAKGLLTTGADEMVTVTPEGEGVFRTLD